MIASKPLAYHVRVEATFGTRLDFDREEESRTSDPGEREFRAKVDIQTCHVSQCGSVMTLN